MLPLTEIFAQIDLPKGFKLDKVDLSYSMYSHTNAGFFWQVKRDGQALLGGKALASWTRASQARRDACKKVQQALQSYAGQFHQETSMRIERIDALNMEAGALAPEVRGDANEGLPRPNPGSGALPLDAMAELLASLSAISGTNGGDEAYVFWHAIAKKNDHCVPASIILKRLVTFSSGNVSEPGLERLIEKSGLDLQAVSAFQRDWDASIQRLFPAPDGAILNLVFTQAPMSAHQRLAGKRRLGDIAAMLKARYG